MNSATQQNEAASVNRTSCSDDSKFRFFKVFPRITSNYRLLLLINRSLGGSNVQKLMFTAIFASLIGLYLFYIYTNGKMMVSFEPIQLSAIPQERKAVPERTKYRNAPVILAWTTFFGYNFAELVYAGLKKCDYQCTVTDDRRIEASADVIGFHPRNMNDSDLPKQRYANQLYLWFLLESPHHTGSILDTIPKDFFNQTMTYRRDSDIFYPYGMLKKIDNSTPEDQIWNWTEVERIARSKAGMVLQLVSHCNTSSKRESYVDQLRSYVNVTRRGTCNEMECDDKCARQLAAEHRFYLSFENSVCRDYITEKLFGRMEELLVPIVLKKSLYIDTLPAGSYIAVDDFKSPRELADYLKYLERNITAYMSYLEWTKHYQKSTVYDEGYCALCKYLHAHAENGTGSKVIQDIKSWWFDGGQCINDYALQFVEKS